MSETYVVKCGHYVHRYQRVNFCTSHYVQGHDAKWFPHLNSKCCTYTPRYPGGPSGDLCDECDAKLDNLFYYDSDGRVHLHD